MSHRLRYIPTAHGGRFPRLRYPSPDRPPVSREQAEKMRAAMPDPDLFEICEENE